MTSRPMLSTPATVLAGLLLAGVALSFAAARSPVVALGLVIGALFVAVAFIDVTAGVVGFVVLQFIFLVPVVNGSGDVTAVKAAGAVLVVAWLVSMFRSARITSFRRHEPLLAAVAAFLAWGAVSFAWAPDGEAAWAAFERYGLDAVLLLIVLSVVASKTDVEWLLRAIAGGAGLAAVIALASGSTATTDDRLAGAVGDANELASLLVTGLILSFALACVSTSVAWRAAMTASAIACLAGIFPTLSRGALLALLGALVVWVVIGGPWRGRLLAGLIVVGAIAMLYFGFAASEAARARVTTLGPSTVAQTSGGGSGRDDIWRVGWRAFKDRPISGQGLGNYAEVTPAFVAQSGLLRRGDLITSSSPKAAHNTYLHILVETGLVGLAAFVAMVGVSFAAGIRAARAFALEGDRRFDFLSRSVIAALAGTLIADIFLSAQYSRVLWITIALGSALAALAGDRRVLPGRR